MHAGQRQLVIDCQGAELRSAGGVARYAAELLAGLQAGPAARMLPDDVRLAAIRTGADRASFAKRLLRATTPPLLARALARSPFAKRPAEHPYSELDPGRPPALVHCLSAYVVTPELETLLRAQRPPLIATIIDIQDRYYPQFFSAASLLERKTSYLYYREYCDAFISISRHAGESFCEWIGAPVEKLHVAQLAASTPPVAEVGDLSLRAANNFAVYPARPWLHKNHDRLLRALAPLAAEMRARKFKLYFTGGFGGADGRRVRKLIHACGLSESVEILGFVSDERLFELFRRATFLFFPSLFEGFGMPVAEALAAACPTIASDLPAIREYAAAGPVYINPEREDSIRDAFAAAMRGETDWDQRVRIGLERARAITWQACSEKTAAVYQRFL